MTQGLTLTTQSDGSQALMGRLAIETLRDYPKIKSAPLKHYHGNDKRMSCLLYTSPSPRDGLLSRMPSSA